MRRLWIWLIALPAALWLVLVTLVWVTQSSLMYFPTRQTRAQAETDAGRAGAIALRDDAGELLGWRWLPPPGSPCSSEWLLAHGNGGMALHRAHVIVRLRQSVDPGACLSILEYPGYGAASGLPNRVAIMRKANALLARVQAGRGGETAVPLLLIGESLGTGVVAELAQAAPHAIAGLLLLTPYDDLAAVARSHHPWLPATLVLRDRFQPALALRDYSGPVLLIVAGADRVIPPRHAEALAGSLRHPRVHVEPGLDHHELEDRPGWWSQVRVLLPTVR